MVVDHNDVLNYSLNARCLLFSAHIIGGGTSRSVLRFFQILPNVQFLLTPFTYSHVVTYTYPARATQDVVFESMGLLLFEHYPKL